MPSDDAAAGSAPSLSIAGTAVPYSLISLVTLTVQNSALAILLHHSRTAPNAKPYSAAAAVLLNEILKGSISFAIALNNIEYQPKRSVSISSGAAVVAEKLALHSEAAAGAANSHTHHHPNGGLAGHGKRLSLSVGRNREMSIGSEESWKRKLHPAATSQPPSLYANKSWWNDLEQWKYRTAKLATACFSPDCWKLAVPACCYVLQNNLQFVAASHLDVATFQVTYQAKILTTAFFSVVMLNKSLSTKKWMCLIALAVGVAIVQLQGATSSSSHTKDGAMDRMTGFVAVVLACITSGFAGVYFEKVLKGSTADLWVRNIQLTLFSLPPALLAALFPDFSLRDMLDGTSTSAVKALAADAPTWLFGNFGFWVMATVFCQVFGGLVTALVIRYSDNIAKGFATSLSIIISFAAGVILFHFQVTLQFLIGCSVVLAATYYYNQPDGVSSPSSGNARFGSYTPVPSLPHINENDSGNTSDSSQSFAVHVSAADTNHTKHTIADRPYPFTEYPNRGNAPPQFANLAPFSSPKVAPPEEHELSPRSPIPPWSEQMPFGAAASRAMAG